MSVRMPVYAEGTYEVASYAESFEGAVLELREKNGYHDSDFYAVVWDAENKTLREVEYATTRFAGGGHADVDVTPETLTEMAEGLREKAVDLLVNDLRERRSVVKVGDYVNLGRGKYKGTAGTVFWKGSPSRYTYNSPLLTKMGVSPSGEKGDDGKYADAVWTNAEYATVERDVNPTSEELAGFEERVDNDEWAAYRVVRSSEPLPEGWVRM